MATTRTSRVRVSAVVPTLNEVGGIPATLESLRRSGIDEIIVVDGGSEDETLAKVEPLADRVLIERGGLFRQLNEGASEATGDVLLFHYADVLFPVDGREAIMAALTDHAVSGGAFRLSFGSTRWRYRVTATFANWRNRVGLGPFGDQSIFARTETFGAVGGFSPGAFFADLALVNALRRKGRFHVLGSVVEASTRRWEGLGFWRTLLHHYRMYVLYFVRRGRPTRRIHDRARSLRTVR
jgi:glycosyltransferase involved in cell wall biosynthesis